ncbi:unnamed protein product [Arabidopsis thaliana]|uniref:(thale cress) hypothetical protein n=1 Tax=Arabidopsis thaliana TaxID=3702 RepID=A0A7G2DZM9_ARATH|nr:unnamed protein product [Arabidopsis thaliana]
MLQLFLPLFPFFGDELSLVRLVMITERAHLRDGDKAASAELIKEMRSCRFAGDASTYGLVTDMLHDGRLDKGFLEMLS